MKKCSYCKAPLGECVYIVIDGAHYCSWQCNRLNRQVNRFNINKFRKGQGGEYDYVEKKRGSRSGNT